MTQKKDEAMVRILFQNVGGIGFMSGDVNQESVKIEKLKKLIIDKSIDIVGLAEVNKDWRCVDTENTVWKATERWREHRRVQVGHNTSRPAQRERQIGGTLMMAFDEVCFRVSKRGVDRRGLGRFSWMEFNGIGGVKTTCITAYCPVISASPGGVFSQHLVYMATHSNDDETSEHFIPQDLVNCPRALFGHDLKKFIQDRQEQGHQIILMGDFNSEYSLLRTWMADLALLDIIGKKHGVDNVPRTHTRSKDSPIDVVFASAHLACFLGGFLSFGKLSGDHRGLWLDIPKALFIGYNIPPPVHPNARRLKLGDPRVVEKYKVLLHSRVMETHTYQTMNSIHGRTVFPLPQPLAEEFETLDAHICSSMDYAEKNCRKLHMGAVPFSPAYKAATMTVEYWTRREKYILGLERNVQLLVTLQKQLEIIYDPSLTLQQVREMLQQARRDRRDCKRRAKSLQREFRNRLAAAKEAAGEGKIANILRNMSRVEDQRTSAWNTKFMLGTTRNGSSTQVTVTNPDGSKSDLTDKADVEAAVMKENERKYHQTEGGSQLLDGVFQNDFGSFGEGPAIDAVLQGTYNIPPHASQATRDFLQACKAPDSFETPTAEPIVTRYRDYAHSWKCRKEKTTSANQHMGHYKACMSHPWLSWLLFQRAEIPTISGYSPLRHRKCIDLMIMKKNMSFEIEKQRTLGILDTEYNHLNKRMQHKAMHKALDQNEIAPEQYSRPGRNCIDHALNRRLTADDRQSKRLCWALAMSDLKGCYDRIVHIAACLALLRLGVSRTTLFSMFETIQRMIHRVRTAFGDSEDTYGGDVFDEWENEMQGALQGNCAGPTIFSTLSSVIFKILRKKGHSDRFCSAISKNLFLLVGFAFVDDCDLIQSGKDPREVAESMQAVIREWGDLMEVTGGALETKKSYWYLIDYEWMRGKWTAVNGDAGDFELSVRSGDNAEVSIEQLDCNEESEMLGIWMAPSGEKKHMVEQMRESALEWGARVRLGKASPADSLAALHTTISMKLKYPLAALTLTEKECNHIMAPAIRAALPKAGFSGSMSSIFRHAPIASLGLNVIDLYTTMGTTQTALLVHHSWKSTPTGQLLRTCIENQVLEMGMYGLIWTNSFPTYSKWCSSHSWLFHVCQFNNDHEIKLNIDHAMLKPKRLLDTAIMDAAQQHFDSKADLRAINRVRMHHKVVSLSDICSANGSSLDTTFLSRSPFGGSRNDFIWPVKHHVSASDYTTWSKAMEFVFSGPNQTLLTPLGDWLVETDLEWLSAWDWFLSVDREFLYFRDSDTEWYRYERRGRSHRAYLHESTRLPAAPIDELVRATVTWDASAIIVEGRSRTRTYRTPPPKYYHYGRENIFGAFHSMDHKSFEKLPIN